MRILCPKCQTAYEIPEAAIPDTGREVQCASCTHSWYQLPHNQPKVEPEPEPPAETETQPGIDTPAPRRLDPSVLQVLEEEARFESEARQRTGLSGLEVQEDLGLPDPPPRKAPAKGPIRDRLAKLQAAEQAGRARPWEAGEEEEKDGREDEAPTEPSDEISVLPPKTRPGPNRNLPAAVSPSALAIFEETERRRGFRFGFSLTAGAIALAILAFLLAPYVLQEFPATAPILDGFMARGLALQQGIADALRLAFARS